MMTKKDYTIIASVLNANEAPLSLVLDFADALEEDNPRFDRTLFVQVSTPGLRMRLDHETRVLDRAREGRA